MGIIIVMGMGMGAITIMGAEVAIWSEVGNE